MKHMHDEAELCTLPTDGFGNEVETFFRLSSTLSLTKPEEQALLDLPELALEQLRTGPGAALQLRGAKLQRRLAYAIPIMRRMLASMTS